MVKFLKRILLFFIMVAVLFALLCWGPDIKDIEKLIFGANPLERVSQQFSETLRAKNELVVFEAEIQAQETFTQDAWLLGTVQKVSIPYTFTIRFVVDLSNIQYRVAENVVTLSISKPQAKYQQLQVDEDNVKKQDWLYPLSAERYAEIKTDLETKLVDKYSIYEEYMSAAWENAVNRITNLFLSFAHQEIYTSNIQIRIVQMEAE